MIQEDLAQRTPLAKTFTIVFNLASLAHIVIIICDDLEISPSTDKTLNIVLLVISALWLFAIVAASI